MHIEKEQLPPTFKAVVEMIHEEELEKVRKKAIEEGKEEGKVIFATELIKDGFQDEKIAQLTGLELEKVRKLRK